MKKILLALTLALLSSCSILAKKNLFVHFPDGDNVDRVYVSGTLMKQAGGISGVGKYSLAAKDAKGVEIYTIDNPNKNDLKTIKEELERILQIYKAEEVVKQTSGKERNEIYILYESGSKKETKPLGLLIVSMEGRNANLVFLETTDFSHLYL